MKRKETTTENRWGKGHKEEEIEEEIYEEVQDEENKEQVKTSEGLARIEEGNGIVDFSL
jgi:hypothetical protein